jgi:hypothetical protein
VIGTAFTINYKHAQENTLAYFAGASMKRKDSFMRLSPRIIVIKLFAAVIYMFGIS